mgnify:CR=1 FL=1
MRKMKADSPARAPEKRMPMASDTPMPQPVIPGHRGRDFDRATKRDASKPATEPRRATPSKTAMPGTKAVPKGRGR